MANVASNALDSCGDYVRAEPINHGGHLGPRPISPTHESFPLGTLIGTSPQWRAALKRASQVAATETTTCLQGESGTGKELVARFIHGASPHRRGPFVAINCAALPEQLLESELFGFEREHLSLVVVQGFSPLRTTDLGVLERQAIEKALREVGGNKARAAQRLGISRTQLYGRLRKHGFTYA